jgi:hypothetical protein
VYIFVRHTICLLLMSIQDSIYIALLGFSTLIFCIRFLNKKMHYKIFACFSVLTLLQELQNLKIISYGLAWQQSQVLYYILTIIVFGYFFYSVLIDKIARNVVAFISLSVMVCLVASYLGNWKNAFSIIMPFCLAIQSCIIALLYFIDKMLQPSQTVKLTRDAAYYISAGTLLWAVYFLFFNATHSYFSENSSAAAFTSLITFNVINIINMFLFCVAAFMFTSMEKSVKL